MVTRTRWFSRAPKGDPLSEADGGLRSPIEDRRRPVRAVRRRTGGPLQGVRATGGTGFPQPGQTALARSPRGADAPVRSDCL